jgi:hypothetical protein
MQKQTNNESIRSRLACLRTAVLVVWLRDLGTASFGQIGPLADQRYRAGAVRRKRTANRNGQRHPTIMRGIAKRVLCRIFLLTWTFGARHALIVERAALLQRRVDAKRNEQQRTTTTTTAGTTTNIRSFNSENTPIVSTTYQTLPQHTAFDVPILFPERKLNYTNNTTTSSGVLPSQTKPP